jgi:PAT family beta-lactamase induction signal transducer AmpG
MTVSPDTAPAAAQEKPSFLEAVAVYFQPRVLIVLFLGFSSGLPLALSGTTLLIWLRESGLDLGIIGLFALAGTPYTAKFLWAPLTDALDAPLLSRWLGRRRGWLVLTQLLLMATIVLLGLCDPTRLNWTVVFAAAVLVATASATQDIVVDAFRIESLPENEQAAGSAAYVAAYRVGMLISTAGALFLVSGFQDYGLGRQAAWHLGYLAMAVLVIVGTITALLATEPERSAAAEAAHAGQRPLARVAEAAGGAFKDFMGYDFAFAILTFVVLFKFTDALSGVMTGPFVIDLGFSRNEYAAIVKGVGLAALLAGGFAGGFIAKAMPLAASLWVGAVVQAIANLSFSCLALVGRDPTVLTLAIMAENFTSAIGTVMFVAYLSALCRNPLHTATQYALLTALAAVGRTYLSSGAGFIAESAGWAWFFVICALAGLPSLLLLAWLQKAGHFKQLVPRTT